MLFLSRCFSEWSLSSVLRSFWTTFTSPWQPPGEATRHTHTHTHSQMKKKHEMWRVCVSVLQRRPRRFSRRQPQRHHPPSPIRNGPALYNVSHLSVRPSLRPSVSPSNGSSSPFRDQSPARFVIRPEDDKEDAAFPAAFNVSFYVRPSVRPSVGLAFIPRPTRALNRPSARAHLTLGRSGKMTKKNVY